MIILEGPDGAGKTTLSRMLLADGLVSAIMLSPGRESRENLWESTRQYQLNWGENPFIAVDRFFYSEIVYGPLFRGKIQFEAHDCINMFGYMAKYCFQVFCLPGPDHLRFVDSENPNTIARIRGVHKRYEDILKHVMVETNHVFQYRWDEPSSYPRLKDEIKRFQKGERIG